MPFTRAVRAGSPVVIGVVGQSGSGKTYSALKIARGLVGPEGRIFGIDTEAGRMKLYSDVTDFMHDELAAPFTVDAYRAKIAEAVKEGADCIVIDQGSFEWSGTGGILEMADASNAVGLLKWGRPKAHHRRFLNALAECPVHIVLCLRGKREFTQEGKGKDAVIIRGAIVAQQQEDFIYEMTISMVFDVEDANGNPRPGVPRIVKCPADIRHAFPDNVAVTEKCGEMVAQWVKGGLPVDHAYEALKLAGRSAALEGGEALKAWFAALTKEQKARIKPLLDEELKRAAHAVDNMAALSQDAQPASNALDEAKGND